MTAGTWRAVRAGAGALVLAVVVVRVGTGPVLDGLGSVGGRELVVAGALALMTSMACAWRWTSVARGLDVPLPLTEAVGAYYRSVFLNVTLPGGVLGDVHRGLAHGRQVSDIGRGLRAVLWERLAGQVVQVVVTLAVLLVAPSPASTAAPFLVMALAVGVVIAAGVASVARTQRSRWSRTWMVARRDIRRGLLTRAAWPAVAFGSLAVVCIQTLLFVVAARTTGTVAPLETLIPLALLVLAAMALPNVAGWGPREGAAAWAFDAAHLGAGRGVSAAAAYGLMVFVGSLPGAAVLLRSRRRTIPTEAHQRPTHTEETVADA